MAGVPFLVSAKNWWGGGNLLNISVLVGDIVGRYYSTKSLIDFKAKHWLMTDSIDDVGDYSRVYAEFDAIITGSDQIWNSACIGTMGLHYYGVNADTEKQRLIAYAPSFGKNRFEASEEDIDRLKGHFSKFRAISVREADGVELLCEKFGYSDAVRVLDPTMLMDASYYMSIAGIKQIKRKKTLAYYLLDKSTEKMHYVKEMALKQGLTPVNMYLPDNNGVPLLGKLRSLRYPSVAKWLRCIAESELVVTDSFHGTVFSIIFNKDFVTFGNAARGNSRFDNLLQMFGLKKRLLESLDDFSLAEKHIDYFMVNQELANQRRMSERFLTNALS